VPRAFPVLQFVFSLLRSRAVRVFLWLLVGLWLFDRLVYFATETQWFASLGLQSVWWARCRAQSELFAGFALVCLALSRFFLGAVAQIKVPHAPALKGKLVRFEALRGGVSRLAWTLAIGFALVGAQRLVRLWPDWLMWRSSAPADFRYLGLPVALWTHWLPITAPLLNALWWFSWLLLALVVVTGVLRALPALAARQPAPPLVLIRTLWKMAAWLLLLRASIHAVRVLDLARGRALQTGDVYISAPLFVLGTVACLLLAVVALRRANSVIWRANSSLAVSMLAAFWLPGFLNWFSAPERSLLPETGWLKSQRMRATRAAWHLDFPSPAGNTRPVLPEQAWPLWDEKMLLQALRAPGFRGRRVVTWQSVTLGYEAGKWRALAAAQSAGATTWTARRDADEDTELALERLDFSAQNGGIVRTPLAGQRAFFGFEGRTLFSNENFGVPIASITSKWLWAWRLRDMFVPLDGANSSHLLVFLGARERAEKIAPFWTVSGEPQLITNGTAPFWMLDICEVTANFPGSQSVNSGPLAGSNAASDKLKMLVDARTGAVQFYSRDQMGRTALTAIVKSVGKMPVALRRHWRAAPELLRAQLAVFNKMRGGEIGAEKSQTIGPQFGFDARYGPLSRAISIRKRVFETLEVPLGAASQPILRRANADFNGRLADIDAILRKSPPESRVIVPGEPFVWPDGLAPGGYWIGRAFFSLPREVSRAGGEGQGAELWRVAITGAASGARVSLGTSLRSAHLDVLGQKDSLASAKSGKSLPLALEALRAHKALLNAIKRGDWKGIGRESERGRVLLEQLAARSSLN
jgi:hypothetical protein